MIASHVEYGVFGPHGSAEILLKTFRNPETVALWRELFPDFEVTCIRTRTVTTSEWSEPMEGIAK